MARQNTIKVLRTTRANLDTQASANALIEGEIYLVTDEGRLAVGTGVGAYSDMGTKAEAVPAGQIGWFGTDSAPSGWLKCDGSNVSRTTYADLFAAISTRWGVGDGSTTFRLPELRGEFVRGWDDGRGVDSGRNLGTFQDEALKAHNHTLPSAMGRFTGGGTTGGTGATVVIDSYSTGTTGGAETRPRNISLLACIKY